MGPGLNPQYTGAPKAGGGCGLLAKSTTTSPMAQPQCSNVNKRKFYLDCSSDALCTRGEFGKGDVLIADLEELETMDASEIYWKRLNAKEAIFPKQGEFIFPIADGRIKPLEEIRN